MQGLISLGVKERARQALHQITARIPEYWDQPGNAHLGAHPVWEAKA